MATALRHRGPDGAGVWVDDRASLGHRRLAIIDLSDAAAQPMTGVSGAVITYNGEIYNYRELRADLEAKGERFRSDSDTEILLRLWEREGPRCLDRLVGMFAFAIWDPRSGRLFLARDRLGKKPLYYAHRGVRLAFGSEPKALFALPELAESAAIDPHALSDFLSLGYVLTPKSIFSGIARLPAGHYAIFDCNSGRLEVAEYWFLHEFFLADRVAYGSVARERFADLLTDAVTLRLRSDVPVGVFLSGGLDSSAIAAIMAEIDQAGTRAFCVGFTEANFDESLYARLVADHLGIPLTVIANSPASPNLIATLMTATDEPFADTSIIPSYLLNVAARHHVTVALTGDGADEILAGYATYRADAYYRLTSRVPRMATRFLSRIAERRLRPRDQKVGWEYKLRQYIKGHGLSAERAHYWWRVILSDAEKRRLMGDDLIRATAGYDPFDTFDAAFRRVAGAGFLDRSLYVDIKTWLQDDILIKADRASMAASLEVRSPFLDHRLVEFVATLDPAAKMDARRQKVALRDMMAQRLPATTLRRPKSGFNAPTRDWGRISLDAPAPDGWFQPGFLLDVKNDNVTFKTFLIATLAAWLHLFAGLRSNGKWGV